MAIGTLVVRIYITIGIIHHRPDNSAFDLWHTSFQIAQSQVKAETDSSSYLQQPWVQSSEKINGGGHASPPLVYQKSNQ